MTMTPIPRARRAAPVTPAPTITYDFHISADVEKRMVRWHAPVREEIRRRLAEIAASVGQSRPKTKAKAVEGTEPPLRFYVYEGYRIAYEIDEERRRVVILEIELLPVS
jgi:mRNA-degrading endonuclease RelE of RelBE toxin-antitoxin system